MTEWHQYPEDKPKEAGTYLIVQDDGKGGKKLIIDVAEYFHKDDFVTARDIPNTAGTGEERLIYALTHGAYAEKDGFYTADPETNKHWELRVTYWAELPDPPAGYTYLF